MVTARYLIDCQTLLRGANQADNLLKSTWARLAVETLAADGRELALLTHTTFAGQENDGKGLSGVGSDRPPTALLVRPQGPQG
jgi:hypothetical protein